MLLVFDFEHFVKFLARTLVPITRSNMERLSVKRVPTSPIAGQKPGTSGLRKTVKVFQGKNYLENYVQSTFDALVSSGCKVQGGVMVVGGDGRYFNKYSLQVVLAMAIANGVSEIWVGQDGLLSTPAMSAVIRTRKGGFVPFGGFVLTASHNPAGVDGDFGIKFNCENGEPAPPKITDKIYKVSQSISEYKTCTIPKVDFSKCGVTTIGGARVEVFNPVDDHVALLKTVFDFEAFRQNKS